MGIKGFLSFLLLASSLASSPSVFAQAPKPGVKPVIEKNTEETATREKLIYKIIPALKPDLEEGEGASCRTQGLRLLSVRNQSRMSS